MFLLGSINIVIRVKGISEHYILNLLRIIQTNKYFRFLSTKNFVRNIIKNRKQFKRDI